MMSKNLLYFLGLILIIGCKPNANSIIKQSIENHGGSKYNDCEISFDFRDKLYTIKNKNGDFEYSRIQTDSLKNKIVDLVSNSSQVRTINGKTISLPDSMKVKYANSVNSVAYFFLLPKPLNDPAVKSTLLEEGIIKNKKYYKIKVEFDEKGGGQDHQDKFVYWINQETYFLDYLAYSYETDGGGQRFREAFNCNTQKGIRYCDYKNYGFEDFKVPLENLDKNFENKTIPLLSEIVNLNIIIK